MIGNSMGEQLHLPASGLGPEPCRVKASYLPTEDGRWMCHLELVGIFTDRPRSATVVGPWTIDRIADWVEEQVREHHLELHPATQENPF